MNEVETKSDDGCLLGCVGIGFYTLLCFGGIGVLIYAAVKLVKWAWVN